MPVVTNLSYVYYPNPISPVGFEATLAVYDTVNGGGNAQTFTTTIVIDPANCAAWSANPAHATSYANTPVPPTGFTYDPNGITATWTGRISASNSPPSTFSLRGRFNGSGVVAVQAQCTQMSDPANSVSRTALVPIPA